MIVVDALLRQVERRVLAGKDRVVKMGVTGTRSRAFPRGLPRKLGASALVFQKPATGVFN